MAGNIIRLNAQHLNSDPMNVAAEVLGASEESGVNVPNGVYIQHINGKLYTTDEWTAKAFANDEANGVAVAKSYSTSCIAFTELK